MAQTAKSVTVTVLVDGVDAVTALARLEVLGVITTDPDRAERCCGISRDHEGRCFHRPGHAIYVGPGYPR